MKTLAKIFPTITQTLTNINIYYQIINMNTNIVKHDIANTLPIKNIETCKNLTEIIKKLANYS